MRSFGFTITDPVMGKTLEKISRRLLTPLHNANGIVITDLLVGQVDAKGRGEYDALSSSSAVVARLCEPEKKLIERLFSSIENLADTAKEHHLREHFEELPPGSSDITIKRNEIWRKPRTPDAKPEQVFVIKKDHGQQVIRLVTHEFFFYPLKKPLSTKVFGQLLAKIEEKAKELPPNLQLILGTFPILDVCDNLNNIVLVVQCGMVPQIDITAKYFPFGSDPAYQNASLVKEKQQKFKQHLVPDFKMGVVADEKNASKIKADVCIPYTGFVPTTVGNARYLTAIEICFDHHNGLGYQQLSVLNSKSMAKSNQLTPVFLSHVVVSNYSKLQSDSLLTHGNVVTHADFQKPKIRINSMYFHRVARQSLYLKFGRKAVVRFYPAVALQQQIQYGDGSANTVIAGMCALRIYRNNHPEAHQIVFGEMVANIFYMLHRVLKSLLDNPLQDSTKDILHETLGLLSGAANTEEQARKIMKHCQTQLLVMESFSEFNRDVMDTLCGQKTDEKEIAKIKYDYDLYAYYQELTDDAYASAAGLLQEELAIRQVMLRQYQTVFPDDSKHAVVPLSARNSPAFFAAPTLSSPSIPPAVALAEQIKSRQTGRL